MISRFVCVLFAGLLVCPISLACTIFVAQEGNATLVGNNEDFYPPGPTIWVRPATKGKYGWIGFGFEKDYPRYPQGGVNEQGLFFDWASLPKKRDVRFPSDRPFFNTYSPVKMLEQCATVAEAIALYSSYNERIFRRSHIIIADKHGDSAIIEWGKDELAIIPGTGRYQLLTNFNITDPELAGGFPCRRYTIADRMLAQGDVSVERFAAILKAVHQRGRYRTQYSNIYDLKNGMIYVYHEHYYYEHIAIAIADETARHAHCYELPSLFAKMEMLLPANGQTTTSTNVTFRWKALPREYLLYCSTDPGFAGCTPVRVAAPSSATGGGASPTTAPSMSSPDVAARCEMAATIESLEPNTQYYWKLVAKGSQGIDCESVVKTFTTGE